MKTAAKTRTRFAFGIAALIAAILFGFAACEGPAGPAGKPGKQGIPGAPGEPGEGGSGGGGGSGNAVEFFTVAFDLGGGSTVTQAVPAGSWAIKPEAPVPAAAAVPPAGLYAASLSDVYSYRWVDEDGSPFDFYAPITQNISLKTGWNIDPVEGTATDMAAASAYIQTNPGTYTMLVGANISSATFAVPEGNDLTLIGLGSARTIQYNGEANANLFSIAENASLTLGQNITLKGIDNGTDNLVLVNAGANLTMKAGSKITGHTLTGSSSVTSTVRVSGTFIMEGGEISGNLHKMGTSGQNDKGGGISIYGAFVMSGGTVSGNTSMSSTDAERSIPSDINVPIGGTFIMSGTATIGAVSLYQNGTTAEESTNSFITFGGRHTGTIGSINLMKSSGNYTSISLQVARHWAELGNTIVKPRFDYSLTASDRIKIQTAVRYGLFVTQGWTIQPTTEIKNYTVNANGILE
jgi:hypothetical protein